MTAVMTNSMYAHDACMLISSYLLIAPHLRPRQGRFQQGKPNALRSVHNFHPLRAREQLHSPHDSSAFTAGLHNTIVIVNIPRCRKIVARSLIRLYRQTSEVQELQ